MRTINFSFLAAIIFIMASCGSNEGSTGKLLCDTACKSDSIVFKGDHELNPWVGIGVKNCRPDSIIWTHDLVSSRTMSLPEFIGAVRMNESNMSYYFKDTGYIWLQFNDCVSGRGYALKLNYDGKRRDKVSGGAFTKFDPKFSIDPDLVAYTDKGSVFVENMATGQQAVSPFDKAYEIDFNKIHDVVDSVNITKTRVWVQMIRDGEKKVYEKKISL
jgi:hypothetical protein